MSSKETKREVRALVTFALLALLITIGVALLERRNGVNSATIALIDTTYVEQTKSKERWQQSNSETTIRSGRAQQPRKSNALQAEIAPQSFLLDTVSAQYLFMTGIMTLRRAEVLVSQRDYNGGFHSLEELRDIVYVIDDASAERLFRYAIFPERKEVAPIAAVQSSKIIDLNRADSAELRSVRGIGERSVAAILDYRSRLGGFHSAEQLTEIRAITESNYEKIITQITCNNYDITKIRVNFANAKQLADHPYISKVSERRWQSIKQMKGGWSRIEEMIEDKIFTHEEAQRVLPYLDFNTDAN